jgi:hypothetical protein
MKGFVFDYAPLYDALRTDKELMRPTVAKNHLSCNARIRIRKVLLDVHGPYCWLCNTRIRGEEPSLDHIVPRSKGGRNSIANLRLAHKRCNTARGNGDVPVLILTHDMRLDRPQGWRNSSRPKQRERETAPNTVS